MVEISDDGASGMVIITNDQGNIVDTFIGSVAAFQASGEWLLMQQAE
jgi:hypothetical protein